MKEDEIFNTIRIMNELQTKKVCPLLNGFCNEQCVCFHPASYKANIKKFCEAKCNNAMMTGKLTMGGSIHTY